MSAEHTTLPNALLLYCRPGFEKECVAEIQEQSQQHEAAGFCKTQADSGFVLFTPYTQADLAPFLRKLHFKELCFARQMVTVLPLLSGLPVANRIEPILAAAKQFNTQFSEVFLETADTNEAKELSAFVRKFEPHFLKATKGAGLFGTGRQLPRLHLFFINSTTVYVGTSRCSNSSPWHMGIVRLRFPRSAPSRSTLKLEEAFLFFLEETPGDLQPGMKAVDLGAAPGGWTWQLVKRSIRVIAVDNGPMDPALLESGIVQHVKADGFKYLPVKPVDWLVCDMVEQPSRIAALVAKWLVGGHCQQAIFNLKLPMKKRYEELKRCRGILDEALYQADVPCHIAFKQLYHDREEVTGYVVRL